MSKNSSPRKILGFNLFIAVAYWVTGKIGLLLPYAGEHVTLIWPPTGIAIAALILHGPKVIPGIFAGAFCVNYSITPSLLVAIPIGLSNTLGPFLGAMLFRMYANLKQPIGDVRSFVRFLVFTVLLSPIVTSINGAFILVLYGLIPVSKFWPVCGSWYLGDMAGIITWSPIFLLYSKDAEAQSSTRLQKAEIFACVAAVFFSVHLAFAFTIPLNATSFILLLFPFIPLIWLSARAHAWVAAATSFLAVHWALWCTSHGQGPFASISIHAALGTCWAYLGMLSLLSLAISAMTTELYQALSAVRSASETKSRFLAAMSHELRTPMNGLLGMIDLVREKELPAEERELLGIAHSSGAALLRILDDVLDLSKVESGRMVLSPSTFSLRSLIQEVEALFRSKMIEHRIIFVAECSSKCPDWVVADYFKIKQVLLNLVSNACKFTCEGGSVVVYVDAIPDDNAGYHLQMNVIDTGIGISADKVAYIFEPFSQEDDTISRRYGGTGLGLPIARSICRHMNGDLSVKSRKEIGSRFTAQFRVERASNELIPIVPAAVPTSPHVLIPPDVQLRILLAEDNEINSRLFAAILKKAGFDVSVANDGLEAVKTVRDEEFDLIFLDIQMPGMDGITVLEEIRDLKYIKHYKVPIVAITANAMLGDREHYLSLGFANYIAKPFKKEEILALIAERIDAIKQLNAELQEAELR